jgi:hypothetical protein
MLCQAVGRSSGRFFSLNLILLEARAILDSSEAGLLNTETSLTYGRIRGGKREEEQSVGKIADERSRSGGPARDGSELRGFSARTPAFSVKTPSGPCNLTHERYNCTDSGSKKGIPA